MNLESINEAVKNNFFQHIDLAKDSEFFRKYDKEFFKDFNIDSPFLDKEEIFVNMVAKIKNIETLDNLNIDDNTRKVLEEFSQKEIKDDIFSNLTIDSKTLKALENALNEKQIPSLNIDSTTLKALENVLNEKQIPSLNKPSKLKV